MKRALIIYYNYESERVLEGASTRLVKLPKYLTNIGWKTFVLAAKIKGLKNKLPDPDIPIYHCKDPFQFVFKAKLSPKSDFLERKTKISELFNFAKGLLRAMAGWFVAPVLGSIRLGWLPFALISGKKLVRNENIDVLITMPQDSGVAGVLLKKITKKPLIVDFADPWVSGLEHTVRFTSSIHKNIERRLENFVLKNCDYAIFVTKTLARDYLAAYPWLKGKYAVIYNGFSVEALPQEQYALFDKFTIVYAGRFYGPQSPELFLMALHKIFERNKALKQEISVIFVGSGSTRAGSDGKKGSNLIMKYQLQDIIKLTDLVPLKKSFEYMLRSHLLLLITPIKALTTKVFDYLATGNPILAIISEGELARFISEYSDNSYIISSENVDEIADAILDAYMRWKEGKLMLTSSEKVERFREKYNRENLAREFVKVFDEVIEK
jgi:glycosyltransferase involved in cell wall biosynthesis